MIDAAYPWLKASEEYCFIAKKSALARQGYGAAAPLQKRYGHCRATWKACPYTRLITSSFPHVLGESAYNAHSNAHMGYEPNLWAGKPYQEIMQLNSITSHWHTKYTCTKPTICVHVKRRDPERCGLKDLLMQSPRGNCLEYLTDHFDQMLPRHSDHFNTRLEYSPSLSQ